MEKPFGFSDAVASDSIKRISSFFYCLRIKRQNIGAVDISAQYKNKIPTKSLRQDPISFLLKCGYVIKL
ncbi:hypothetical protein ACNOHN_15070 [Bacteroides zhangwenhongii]|jgi:hypothetical protein|uniref:hypothetical protein n=1 Tax=Bacteroides zhangwenhongii TaxID=2650157 RepID=UPI00117E6A8F|nr:hypothetical protein [Bacteroides zhangwenhongii]